MAESSGHDRGDLNTFQEGTGDSKTVDKETINTEVENDTSSSNASIAYEIDEDIASIQAEAILAVAKYMDRNASVGVNDEWKQNNLEIEAALNARLETIDEEASSSGDLNSRTECQLAAYYAKKRAEDAFTVIDIGRHLMETIRSTIDVLQSHIQGFTEKAVEATELGTERGRRTGDFYHTMAMKYESTVAALDKRCRRIRVALSRLQECADECGRFAAIAEKITDETTDESRRIKYSACWWNNKGRATIIVALKKERAALLMMRRMWINVQNDMEYEERNKAAFDSDDETQQCENRDRKTKIGHIVTTLLGLALLSVTCLFQVGSDSFNAILALGLLTTGWCAVYWSHKLYKCLKDQEGNQETATETERQDGFIQNCDRYLQLVSLHLDNFEITPRSDEDSDAESVETARIDDSSR